MLARSIRAGMDGINPADLNQYGKAIVFDPQDLRTLYQDSAGMTPVTGVEQPVGLMLDKGQGVKKTNIYTSDFSSGIDGFSGGLGSIASVDNSVQLTTSAVNGYANRDFTTVVNKWYGVKAKIRKVSGGGGGAIILKVSTPSFGNSVATAPYVLDTFIEHTIYYYATTTSTRVYIQQNASGTASLVAQLKDITLDSIEGHHATQSTAGSRPTLSGPTSTPYLTFDGSADFAATATGGKSTAAFYYCASVKIGKINAAQTLISDTGTNTGYRVRINASNQLEFSAGNGSAYTTVATAGTALALNDIVVLSAWHDGENLNAQINDGTIYQAAFATATAGTDALTVGKDNGAASSYFGGNIYGMFNSGPVPNINLRNALKRHYAAKAGIRL